MCAYFLNSVLTDTVFYNTYLRFKRVFVYTFIPGRVIHIQTKIIEKLPSKETLEPFISWGVNISLNYIILIVFIVLV